MATKPLPDTKSVSLNARLRFFLFNTEVGSLLPSSSLPVVDGAPLLPPNLLLPIGVSVDGVGRFL